MKGRTLPNSLLSFTYYVIKEGEGGFQMITFDYEGGGGILAQDNLIKNIPIYHKFSLNFGPILLSFSKFSSNFDVQTKADQLYKIMTKNRSYGNLIIPRYYSKFKEQLFK